MKGDFELGHQCSACANIMRGEKRHKVCIHCGAWKPKWTEVTCKVERVRYLFRPWTWGNRHVVLVAQIPKNRATPRGGE